MKIKVFQGNPTHLEDMVNSFLEMEKPIVISLSTSSSGPGYGTTIVILYQPNKSIKDNENNN